MFRKGIFILCAQAILMKIVSAQYVGATNPYGYEVSWAAAPSGSWEVPYISAPTVEWAYAPASTFISVVSENGYVGGFLLDGPVPFFEIIATDDALPTAPATTYGNGGLGITVEDISTYELPCLAGNPSYGLGINRPIPFGSGVGYGPNGYVIY